MGNTNKAEYMREYRKNNPVLRLHIKKDLLDKVELKCAKLNLSHTEYLTNLIEKDIEKDEDFKSLK
ncbi:MAG: hypothetical protein IKT33_01640 [Clostridia bacterium]|nr:hypothetical protein [Clostridia bacterium]